MIYQNEGVPVPYKPQEDEEGDSDCYDDVEYYNIPGGGGGPPLQHAPPPPIKVGRPVTEVQPPPSLPVAPPRGNVKKWGPSNHTKPVSPPAQNNAQVPVPKTRRIRSVEQEESAIKESPSQIVARFNASSSPEIKSKNGHHSSDSATERASDIVAKFSKNNTVHHNALTDKLKMFNQGHKPAKPPKPASPQLVSKAIPPKPLSPKLDGSPRNVSPTANWNLKPVSTRPGQKPASPNQWQSKLKPMSPKPDALSKSTSPKPIWSPKPESPRSDKNESPKPWQSRLKPVGSPSNDKGTEPSQVSSKPNWVKTPVTPTPRLGVNTTNKINKNKPIPKPKDGLAAKIAQFEG